MPKPEESKEKPEPGGSLNCPRCGEELPDSPNLKYCFACGKFLREKKETYSARMSREEKDWLNWLAEEHAHGDGPGLLRKMGVVFVLAEAAVRKGDKTLPKMVRKVVEDDQVAFNVALKQSIEESEKEKEKAS